MSMIPQPHYQSPPGQKQTLRSLLKEEWHRLEDMDPLRLCLLFLPTIVILCIDPLLPLAAYALQLWASLSWAWRDRWPSVIFWAKQGSGFVTLLLIYTALDVTHAWIIPDVTAMIQALWHTILPGTVSLDPFDERALLARSLLLLPLAPLLSLFYERLDPRTRVQNPRVLTPADLVEPAASATKKAPASSPQAAHQAQPEQASTNAPAPQAKTPKPKSKHKNASPPAQQMAIESFLSTTPAPSVPPPPPKEAETPEPEQKKVKPFLPSSPTNPPASSINWDDVAE
jgi:hypothetical protein